MIMAAYRQAYLGDSAVPVLNYLNKTKVALKQVTQIFGFLMHISYVYTTL